MDGWWTENQEMGSTYKWGCKDMNGELSGWEVDGLMNEWLVGWGRGGKKKILRNTNGG